MRTARVGYIGAACLALAWPAQAAAATPDPEPSAFSQTFARSAMRACSEFWPLKTLTDLDKSEQGWLGILSEGVASGERRLADGKTSTEEAEKNLAKYLVAWNEALAQEAQGSPPPDKAAVESGMRAAEAKLAQERRNTADLKAGLAVTPFVASAIRACAEDQRAYIKANPGIDQPPPPPPAPKIDAHLTGTWTMECASWSPDKFSASGTFEVDLFAFENDVRKIKGNLTGVDAAALPVTGVSFPDGRFSFRLGSDQVTSMDLFGTVAETGGTFKASGQINATYKQSTCAGTWTTT